MTKPMPQNQPTKEDTEQKILADVEEISKEKKNPKILKTFKQQLNKNKLVTA